MAEGRMVNRSVATDERLNGMSREAMLLFLMTIPHLDRDGLTDGRPRVLWATVAPLQDDWLHGVDALIEEWLATGMVVRYFDGGCPILFFTGFAKNQRRMLYQRERASKFPCPPGFVRTPVGLHPADDAAADAPARAELGQSARAGRAQDASSMQDARDEVAQTARPGPAEDQDQTEDQDQDQTEKEEEDHHQDQSQAEAEVGGGGDHSSAFPRALGRGTLVTGSAGNLIASFTLEELRAAAYQLGSLLGLHMEWKGYESFLARREAGSLAILLEWIQFYSAMPATALEKIDNLPGLIRSHLNKGERAALTGRQRRALVGAVLEALAAVEESP